MKDLLHQPKLKDTLDIWDMQMVKYGCQIIRKRKNFICELNEIIRDIHRNLTGKTEEIHVIYEPNVNEEELEPLLLKNRDRDIRMKLSSTGPHRDDFCVMVNGIDIRKIRFPGTAADSHAFFEAVGDLSGKEKDQRSTPGASSG